MLVPINVCVSVWCMHVCVCVYQHVCMQVYMIVCASQFAQMCVCICVVCVFKIS